MPADCSSLFDRFEPVSLASMDAAASLQTRIDTKYIVPIDVFESWQQALVETHRALEIGGNRTFTYDTQYFDTPALGFYRAHIQGQRKRFKVRTRRYVETDRSFLEIKLKGGRGETIKKRIAHDPDRLDVMDANAISFIRECVADLYEQEFSEQLVPTVRTRYRRSTLVAMELAERITCDFDLGFQRPGGTEAGLLKQFVLIEIKTARGRGSSDRELWKRGMRPLKGSKYCIGVSMTGENVKNNQLRRQISRFYR